MQGPENRAGLIMIFSVSIYHRKQIRNVTFITAVLVPAILLGWSGGLLYPVCANMGCRVDSAAPSACWQLVLLVDCVLCALAGSFPVAYPT